MRLQQTDSSPYRKCANISDNEHLCSQSAFVGQLEVSIFLQIYNIIYSFVCNLLLLVQSSNTMMTEWLN